MSDYQATLDALAAAGRTDEAHVLMDQYGGDDSVLMVDGLHSKHFFFAGRIVIARGAKISGTLRAGRGIEAFWGIETGENLQSGADINAVGIKAGGNIKAAGHIAVSKGIEAGFGIQAGDIIKTGDGWAVFAGVALRISDWPASARVLAKAKPANLYGGYWVGEAA